MSRPAHSYPTGGPHYPLPARTRGYPLGLSLFASRWTRRRSRPSEGVAVGERAIDLDRRVTLAAIPFIIEQTQLPDEVPVRRRYMLPARSRAPVVRSLAPSGPFHSGSNDRTAGAQSASFLASISTIRCNSPAICGCPRIAERPEDRTPPHAPGSPDPDHRSPFSWREP